MTNNSNKVKISLVFFILLTFISLAYLYQLLQTPIEKISAESLYSYEYQGIYEGIASLKPNVIYDNRTVLRLSEGNVYRRTVKDIYINFSYNFEGNLLANLTIKYNVNETIVLANWKKQINKVPERTITSTGYNLSFTVENISIINLISLQQLVSKFSEDTGIYVSQYSLDITTEIYIKAETSAGILTEYFAPQLTMEFKSSTAEGEIISIKGMEKRETGEIVNTKTIYDEWVLQQRNSLFAISTVSLFGLIASSWHYMKMRTRRSPEPQKLLEDFMEPYEELIVEASKEQFDKEYVKTSITINVNALEELVKIAETLEKPIIHIQVPPETHVFHIIDGLTKYEFVTTISILQKSKETIEEEEDE